ERLPQADWVVPLDRNRSHDRDFDLGPVLLTDLHHNRLLRVALLVLLFVIRLRLGPARRRLWLLDDLHLEAVHLRRVHGVIELHLDETLAADGGVLWTLEVATNPAAEHVAGTSVSHSMSEHLDLRVRLVR